MKSATCIPALLAAALSTLALVACDDAPAGSDALSDEEVALEIVDNLRQAGYPDAEIEVRDDDTVIVGGDAVVSLEASREMIGHDGHDDQDEHDDGVELRHYRTTNQVAAWVDKICVDGSALTGTASTALDEALANYTDLDLSFDMVRTSGAAVGCDALITLIMYDGKAASSGFPSGGLPYATVYLGDDIAPSFGLAVTKHVITHELGHCIGLRHTDYYNRAISCGSGGNEGDAEVGVVHIPGTPTTATWNGSIMNACYNTGNTGEWTASDVTALTTLYPKSPLPPAPSPLNKYSEACYGLYDITWTPQAGATHYQLYRSTSSGFTSPVQVYSGSDTYAPINVASGTWYLRARSCNTFGCSAWSNQVSATRLATCN